MVVKHHHKLVSNLFLWFLHRPQIMHNFILVFEFPFNFGEYKCFIVHQLLVVILTSGVIDVV